MDFLSRSFALFIKLVVKVGSVRSVGSTIQNSKASGRTYWLQGLMVTESRMKIEIEDVRYAYSDGMHNATDSAWWVKQQC
eukprot:c49802_g1_i1 orf=392-631(-)